METFKVCAYLFIFGFPVVALIACLISGRKRKTIKMEIELIEKKQKPDATRTMLFTDLKVGDLFKDPVNENIYMCISPMNTELGYFNAIDTYTGKAIYFENEHHVEKI